MYKIRVLGLVFGIWFMSFMQVMCWICIFPIFYVVFICLPKMRSKIILKNLYQEQCSIKIAERKLKTEEK